MRRLKVPRRTDLVACLRDTWQDNVHVMDRLQAARQYQDGSLEEELHMQILASQNIILAVLVYLFDGSDIADR